jgi:Flp pilus assembly protein TadB
LAEKIGKILSCIYRNSKHKKINEVLNILGSEKKFAINFNAFLGYKIIILFLCIAAGSFIGVNTLTSISMGMICGVVGFFIPDFLLNRYNNRRLEDLNKDLPYIIDLLYIATLSGQNIYNSIKILIEKYRGSICLELERFLKDIDYGMGKIKAYRNIMARNTTEDFKNLPPKILKIYFFCSCRLRNMVHQ